MRNIASGMVFLALQSSILYSHLVGNDFINNLLLMIYWLMLFFMFWGALSVMTMDKDKSLNFSVWQYLDGIFRLIVATIVLTYCGWVFTASLNFMLVSVILLSAYEHQKNTE